MSPQSVTPVKPINQLPGEYCLCRTVLPHMAGHIRDPEITSLRSMLLAGRVFLIIVTAGEISPR